MNMLLLVSGEGASWLEQMREKLSGLTIIHLTRKLFLSVALWSHVIEKRCWTNQREWLR